MPNRSPRRAVFTGLGLVTPIGLDLPTVWDNLRAGRTGVRTIRAFDASPLPCRIGAEVDFDARALLDKKDRKRLGQAARAFQFMVVAARRALAEARLEPGQVDPTRLGVFIGSSTLPGEMAELGPAALACTDVAAAQADMRKWGDLGLSAIPPMWLLNHIPNIMACHVSILADAQGPSNTITQSDAGGLLALGEAWRALQQNKGDAMLVGAADNRTLPVNLVRHGKMFPLSHRNDDPARACRPFDAGRDGRVLGEGGACLVLEELDLAVRRGAPILAELVGFAAGFDRGRTGQGLVRVMRQALEEAGIGPADLDHVNAHGFGTIEDDRREARALHEVLEGTPVPVLPLKGFFGTLGAAGGPVELGISLMALQRGETPPAVNHDEPDPDCPVQVARKVRPVEKSHVLKLAFTELGQCAAVVVKKWS